MSVSLSMVMWWSAGDGIARGRLGGQRQAQGDADPVAHEPRSSGDVLCGEVVKRPAFVVLAPATPVADSREQGAELARR